MFNNKIPGSTKDCSSIHNNVDTFKTQYIYTKKNQLTLLTDLKNQINIYTDLLIKLTSTSMVPARRRAPKMISNEPIRNRNIASAIALYGIFGGLFLNLKVDEMQDIQRRGS